jgi:dTDP-4-dehydrorhamnose reductase
MRIAITGADGQLGTDVVEALSGHDLVCYVEPGRRGGAYKALDITDRRAVAIAIAADHPQWVINTAAMTDVDGCEGAVVPAVTVNGIGARNVAEACAAHGATLIHISTDYVFDGERDDGYGETDSPHPVNVYGMSKLMGEWYVADECERHYIVRSSGLYGRTPAVGKGGANFVETMLRLAGERDSLKVVSEEAPPFGVYHATNGGRCSWFEFAGEIFRIAGVEIDLQPISSREWNAPARRPANSVLNNDALTTHGCDVMPDWRDALARYLRQRTLRER